MALCACGGCFARVRGCFVLCARVEGALCACGGVHNHLLRVERDAQPHREELGLGRAEVEAHVGGDQPRERHRHAAEAVRVVGGVAVVVGGRDERVLLSRAARRERRTREQADWRTGRAG